MDLFIHKWSQITYKKDTENMYIRFQDFKIFGWKMKTTIEQTNTVNSLLFIYIFSVSFLYVICDFADFCLL
jgi:hypothetical protein